jgi:2,3,4,5-tetrahydropyridine-2,6-dicarboxylate N-succinyltransferase
MSTQDLQATIDAAWEVRTALNPTSKDQVIRDAVEHVIADLNAGRKRVAEKIAGEWVTHQWIKKAVLLSFRLNDNVPMHAGDLGFFDKVQTKFAKLDADAMRATGVRGVDAFIRQYWRVCG